ncbi:50S ribosomal protein L30P, partial [mine drainage metagenome]
MIRIRGRTGIREPIEDTLRKLRLTRINHMVVVPESKVFKGMLNLAKDYITWGEISKETLALALKERALLTGRKKI